MGQYEVKSIAMIRLVCQVLLGREGKGNLGLAFDEHLLGELRSERGRPNSIDTFCNMHCEYVLALGAEELLRIFRGLTKAGVNCCAL